MKKIGVYLSVWILVLACAMVVESASEGNPGFIPERGRYIIGFEYGSVKGRNLSDSTFGTQALDTESAQYLTKIVYGLSDRISLLAKVGSADLKLWNPNASVSYSYSGDLAWGGGFRTNFYEDLALGLSLGLGAQYFTFEPKKTSDNRTAEWKEWDGSLYMCMENIVSDATSLVEPFKLSSTSFHAGVRYSDVKVDWTYGSATGQLAADDSFGFFVGFDFVFDENYIMGVEARFSDEKAYSAVLGFRF
jgi:hypothetical protein